MKKIVTIIGARPQFIKAAVLSRLIRSAAWNNKFTEVLVHTGQHYDQNMSDVFFTEMEIPKPDYNLNIGSGTHGKMTGEMLIQIENVLLKEKPDIVLVYGDTNSTIAGALAAAKLHIPVAHVEAGLRSFWKYMPEEQNRILTDHLADWLFCPTETAIQNLRNEGITNGVFNTGDIMFDAHLFYRQILENELNNRNSRLAGIAGITESLLQKEFALATVHRAENTDDTVKLTEIIDALSALPIPVIWPLHPRTRKTIENQGLLLGENMVVIEPVGYFQMLELELKCSCIITDSGGVQKEAFFAKKPCITLREQTEWVETVDSGWNTLAGTNADAILQAFNKTMLPMNNVNVFGNGESGQIILKLLNA
jgi:UDP-GlcNAc3NAcA epimerase